jgi:hypothetical protein
MLVQKGFTLKKILLGAIAAMLLVAPAADAKAFRGTVVKKGTRSVVVATKSGALKTVKTSKRLKLGTLLRVNGKSVKVVGRSTRAHISGVVRGNTASRVVLSGNRTTVSVKPRRHHGAGDSLNMTVKFKNGVVVETTSHDDDDVDDAELKGIATVDAAGVHLTVNGQVVDITIPAGADTAAIMAFDGMFVEVEVDVVNGVNVLRKIKAEDDNDADEDEGLDEVKGTLTVNADGTTITVTPKVGGALTLNINGVSLAGLATGALVEVHFDVVNGPSGQVMNLTRIKSEDNNDD